MKLLSICQVFPHLALQHYESKYLFSSSYFIHIKKKHEVAVDAGNLIFFVLSKQ